MENVKQKAEWSKKYSPITGASTIILQLIIYAVLLAPALSAQIARSIPAPDIDVASYILIEQSSGDVLAEKKSGRKS